MTQSLTESEFCMWRTLFALAHVDGHVSEAEVRFMAEAMEDVPFSDAQKSILTHDMKEGRDIVAMFEKISDIRDQARFFKYAHDIAWSDGEYSKAEQNALLQLQVLHLKKVNVDDLVGRVKLEFAEEDADRRAEEADKMLRKKRLIFSFRRRFLEDK